MQRSGKSTDQTQVKKERGKQGELSNNCNSTTFVEDKDDDEEEDKENGGDAGVLHLRPLNMEDMRKAKSQVSSSFASEGAGMNELKSWNELFGEGGSRRKEQLTYFL